MRKVASLGGVKYYGLPMGTPITADVLEKARDKNKGRPAPKGSTKQTRATSPVPQATKGFKPPAAVAVKPSKPAEPTLAERLQGIKAKKPLEGSEYFRIGNSNFSAPEGTRVFYMDGREDVGLVVPPEGDLRVFNERGEVAISSRTEARVKAEMINAGASLEEVLLGEDEENASTKPSKSAKKQVQAVDFDYDPTSEREQMIQKQASATKAPAKKAAAKPEKKNSVSAVDFDFDPTSERELAAMDFAARKNAPKVDDHDAYSEAREWSGVDTMARLGWRTRLDVKTGLETRENADGSKQYRQFPPLKAPAKKAAAKPEKKQVQAVDFDYDPTSEREQAIQKQAGKPTKYDLRDKPKEYSEKEIIDRARKTFESRQKAAETRSKNEAARIAATQAMLEKELESEGRLPPVSYEDRARARQEKKRVHDMVETSNLKIRELEQKAGDVALPEHLSREDWMPAGQVFDKTSGRLVADPTASPELVAQRQLLETRKTEAEHMSIAVDRLLQRYDEENPSSEPQITPEEKKALEAKKTAGLRSQLAKYISKPGKQKKLYKPTRKPDSLGQTVQIDKQDIDDLQASIFSAPHLNPDGTFTAERRKLHDEIIASFLEGVAPTENPVQYMNGGGPASGKGTMTKGRNAELTNYPSTRKVDDESPEGAFEEFDGEPEAILIDPDSMKMQLPEVKEARQRISEGLYDDLDPHWASNAHTESSYLAARLHTAALDRGVNLIFDGTGNGKESSVLGKALSARKAGYRIEANYLYLEPEEGIKRAKSRADRSHRVVPEAVITGTYKNIPPIFDAVKEGVFDKVNLFDNNVDWGQPAKVIGQGGGDQFNIIDSEAYARFQRLSDKLQQTRSSRGEATPAAPAAPAAPKTVPGNFDRSFREVASSEYGTVISNNKGESFIHEMGGWTSLDSNKVRDFGDMNADDWKLVKHGDGGKPTPSPERVEAQPIPGVKNGSVVEQRELDRLPAGTMVASEGGDFYSAPEEGDGDLWSSLDGDSSRITAEMTGRWSVIKLGEYQRRFEKPKAKLAPINAAQGETIPQRLLSRLPIGTFIENSKGQLFSRDGDDAWTGPSGRPVTTAKMKGDWTVVKGASS